MTINRTHALGAVNDWQKYRRIRGKDEVREVTEKKREREGERERERERERD